MVHFRKFIRYGAVVAGAFLVTPLTSLAAQTTADRTATTDDDRDGGFDVWCLLGLLGLAGLLGRKRPDVDRVETRRV